MAIDTTGLNLMIDGIGQRPTLYLAAYSGTGGTTFIDSVLVTYDAASAATADLATVNPTITIPTATTVTTVRLQTTAVSNTTTPLVSKTISAVFADGGDLIIESYELSVTSTDA